MTVSAPEQHRELFSVTAGAEKHRSHLKCDIGDSEWNWEPLYPMIWIFSIVVTLLSLLIAIPVSFVVIIGIMSPFPLTKVKLTGNCTSGVDAPTLVCTLNSTETVCPNLTGISACFA